jgi:hypothetical protein
VSGAYERDLDPGRGVVLHVEFTTVRREVTDYAVVLSVAHQGRRQTVRVYDGAHGVNEMHRHTAAGGKQPGEVVNSGSLGEGMRAAIAECMTGCEQMIEAWHR